MEQSDSPVAGALEGQLRSMILSNVTVSNNHTITASNNNTSQGPPRGRGHHYQNRRPFPRGPPRPADANQASTLPQQNLSSADFPSLAEGKGVPQSKRVHRNQPSNRASGPKGLTDRMTQPFQQREQYARQPRPNHRPAQPSQSGQPPNHPIAAQDRKILQRPQDSTGQINAPPASLMGPPHLRNQPRPPPNHQHQENPMAQVEFLDWIASREVPKAEITLAELEEKEAFRKQLEGVMKEAVAQRDSGDMATLSLVGFGSLASGFATPGSDMDLAIVPIWKDKSSGMQKYEIDGDIPRLLEKAVLESKMGGRLLTRTRVPILKVCQRPTEKLYTALYDERIKWDNLSDEEKYPSDNPSQVPKDPAEVAEPPESAKLPLLNAIDDKRSPETAQHSKVDGSTETKSEPTINIESSEYSRSSGLKTSDSKQSSLLTSVESASLQLTVNDVKEQQEQKDPKEQNDLKRPERRWAREKVLGPLDFPKSGIGIQCDINFSNPLGIHNTHLLRCYSLCDPRVRPMVLFVKSWAKRRQINSSYSGTLSSYGWVLMVLHYLINIVQPPVCPNLQLSWRAPTNLEELEKMFKETMIGGYPVRFWRDEQAITQSAQRGMLTRNKHSLGALLRGFFQYYATPFHGSHYGPRPPSFYWTNEVLSLRTLGGVRSKQEKGWTGAKTTIAGGKEVRNRYLFAIEDPFEIDHNVARTVTHHGIVAIRDEFRRAWRIVSAVGKNQQPEGDLFDEVVDKPPPMPQKVEEKEVGMDNMKLATLETGAVDGDAAQNVSELQD